MIVIVGRNIAVRGRHLRLKIFCGKSASRTWQRNFLSNIDDSKKHLIMLKPLNGDHILGMVLGGHGDVFERNEPQSTCWCHCGCVQRAGAIAVVSGGSGGTGCVVERLLGT